MSTFQPTEAVVPADPRHAWIAEAAYYRAERRGFQGGCPIEDWLAAEREIHQRVDRLAPAPRIALVHLNNRPVDEA